MLPRRLFLFFFCLCGTAHAHGDLVPKRSGIVAWAQELSIEFVQGEDGKISLWIDDHGMPVDVSGAEGVFTVNESHHELQVRSAEVLEAHLSPLAPNDRVVVVFKLATGMVGRARILP